MDAMQAMERELEALKGEWNEAAADALSAWRSLEAATKDRNVWAVLRHARDIIGHEARAGGLLDAEIALVKRIDGLRAGSER